MSRQLVLCVVVLASVTVGGWALAQQTVTTAGKNLDGPFVVSQAGSTALLLDTESGKTWVLNSSVSGISAWVPAKRLDTEDDFQQWKNREEVLQGQLDEIRKFLEEKRDADLSKQRKR